MVVEAGSTVEFVSALAPNVFDARGEPVAPTADAVSWLRVRIDGREGWVREPSDLQALGLFSAG